jgi:HAD superfamily hydrolase (TIGR01490 family)
MGRISFWQLLEGMLYLAAYKLNALDFERVMAKALSTVAGEHEETVRRWTHEWYRQEVAPHVAPGARAVLAQHRHQGHALVLLTSSSPYESEIATEHLGLEAFLCSRYEVQDGILTGAPVRPLCYGGGKVVWAERFAQERGVDLKASYFYSDSSTDVEMLERVGHPRVVSPDLRLRRLAKRRGWPILDWRSP